MVKTVKFFFLNLFFAFFLMGASVQNFLLYKVKKGDNYSKIAKKYNLDFQEIYALNNKKKLYPSSIIRVTPYFYHTIQKGETLLKIAFDNQVNLKDIFSINKGIKQDNIFYNQEIKIPFPAEIDFINKMNGKNKLNQEKLFRLIYNHFVQNQEEKIIESLNEISEEEIKKVKLPITLAWPLKIKTNRISSKVINREGLIVETSTKNHKVFSSQKGKVTYVGKIRGYGNSIFIQHQNQIYSVYLGLKKINLEKNQLLSQGQYIGNIDHYLYFYVFQKANPINPQLIF